MLDLDQRFLDSLDEHHRELLDRAYHDKDPIARLWLAPWRVMERPDPWQRDALSQLITSGDDVLMCCSRASGKTETFAAAAYVEAQLGGFAMLLSASDRQSTRIIERSMRYHRRLNLSGLTRETMHELRFTTGGRILALPCSGDTIVGEHGISLMGMDEAARIPDPFYSVVTPMLAVSAQTTGIKPRLALLSTPFGQRGFFWEEWEGRGSQKWKRHRYPWNLCPRITPKFIEEERSKAGHGDWWVEQEFECRFHPTVGGFFDVERFEASFAMEPLPEPDVVSIEQGYPGLGDTWRGDEENW